MRERAQAGNFFLQLYFRLDSALARHRLHLQKIFALDAYARTEKSRSCLTLSFRLVRIEAAVSSFKAVSAAALRSHLPKWRNWQTRMVQVHVPARVWGFESLL